jgi:hypothetical protein
MNTTLLVQITGQTWSRLDLFEDIPITITYQQTDLTDFSAVKVPYSKTIQLPGTSNNDKVFEHYFEVNGTDLNPLNKVQCQVQYRGTDIFSGVLRLNSVTTRDGTRLYEIYILGQVADWGSEIREFTLQELDWYDLQHELNYSSVTKSWEAKNTNTDGLKDGSIIYPMINYGLLYTGTTTASTPSFTYEFGTPTGFDQSQNALPASIFKPALKIKTIIDKIFEKTSYELKSDFFNTAYFRSIFMDTFLNGKLGIETEENVQNRNIFKVYSNTNNSNQPSYFSDGTLQIVNFPWQTFLPDGYDPLNNFVLGPDLQTGYFRAPYTGTYYFNVRFNYFSPEPSLGLIKFYILGNKAPTLVNLQNQPSFYLSQEFNAGSLPEQSADLYFSGDCNIGDFVKLYVLIDPTSNFLSNVQFKGFSVGSVTTAQPMWDCYNSPVVGVEVVDFKIGVPNLNALDFMRSLITMFNLVVVQDEEQKVIEIEPYNWYYNDETRPVKDWTNIVDLNEDFKVSPLSFDLSKEVVWTNEDRGFEFLNYEFVNTNDFQYGRYKYVSPFTALQGESIYETNFGSVPTSGITGGENFIIPKFYYLNNGQETPYTTDPHLFFWVGNRFAYKDRFKTIPGTWYFASGGTPIQQTTYPAVSHLSNLDIQIPSLVSDLNFRGTFDYFGNNNNQPVQFTENTLYNLYWDTFIDNIYSPETRRLECRVFLKPIDIYETSLLDKIFIKDTFWTIEKISDADLVNRKLTLVSLVKNTIPFYKVIPPAPVHAISGNTPYPGVEPFVSLFCFVSEEQSEVCLGTAPVIQVYTFTTGGLQNLDVVWRNTGTQFEKYEQGYYIRQVVSTDTFVVIDNYGRILQQPC